MPLEALVLAPNEKVILDRRRRGESMRQAADRLRISLYTYRLVERAKVRAPVFDIKLGRIPIHERCFLKRLRMGLTSQELASRMRVCKWWLTQMERGDAPIDRLREYWGL